MRKLQFGAGTAVLVLASLLSAAGFSPAWAEDTAPALELSDHTGQLHRLEDYRGKIVLLNFWATWCGPCRQEIPILVEANKKWGPSGVVVLAASLDDDQTKAGIPDFVKKYKMTFPVLSGAMPEDMIRFGAGEILPATVILNRDGEIVARILGQARKGDVFNRVEWMLGLKKGKEPPALMDHRPKR